LNQQLAMLPNVKTSLSQSQLWHTQSELVANAAHTRWDALCQPVLRFDASASHPAKNGIATMLSYH